MTIKETIEAFIKKNEELKRFLERVNEESSKSVDLTKDIKLKLETTNYSLLLGPEFARSLQLCDNKESLLEFELEDIRKLFKALTKLEAEIIDNYYEAASFEWAVMDNKTNALRYIKEGISETRKLLHNLEQLEEEIKNN